jgi:hypothetical protein
MAENFSERGVFICIETGQLNRLRPFSTASFPQPVRPRKDRPAGCTIPVQCAEAGSREACRRGPFAAKSFSHGRVLIDSKPFMCRVKSVMCSKPPASALSQNVQLAGRQSAASSRNNGLNLLVYYHLKLLVDKYRTIVLICFSRAVIVYKFVCESLAAAAQSGRLLPRSNDPPAEENGKTNGRNRDKNGGYSDGP